MWKVCLEMLPFTKQTSKQIGKQASNIMKFDQFNILSGTFNPVKSRYSCIWCQWFFFLNLYLMSTEEGEKAKKKVPYIEIVNGWRICKTVHCIVPMKAICICVNRFILFLLAHLCWHRVSRIAHRVPKWIDGKQKRKNRNLEKCSKSWIWQMTLVKISLFSFTALFRLFLSIGHAIKFI